MKPKMLPKACKCIRDQGLVSLYRARVLLCVYVHRLEDKHYCWGRGGAGNEGVGEEPPSAERVGVPREDSFR